MSVGKTTPLLQALVYIDALEYKLEESLTHIHCQPSVCVGWTGQDANHNNLNIRQRLAETSDKVPLVKWVNDEQLNRDMDMDILTVMETEDTEG